MDVPVADEVVLFEGFRFDRRGGGLFRQDASGGFVPVAIGQRALDVLAFLIAHRGELVSKHAIMQAVWRGIAVEDKNLAVHISALRRVLDDGRGAQSCIQTEAGRGYRFVAIVTRPDGDEVSAPPFAPHALTAGTSIPDSGVAERTPPLTPIARWRPIALVGLATLLLAIGSGAWWLHFDRPAPLREAQRDAAVGRSDAGQTQAPPISLVVLPFENLGDDRKDDYLADGITDDLTTDLSRIPDAFVIARGSAYAYKGKATDLRQVGRELGVRYAIEGSVRKLGDVLRVNAQLVATETGAHLWADRFDLQLKELSAGQGDIARRIAQTLSVAVTDVESARSKREHPTDPDAFDLIIRARSMFLHPMGVREYAERLALYEQALQLDPSSVLALTGAATELIRLTFIAHAANELERAGALIRKAAAISPNHLAVLDANAYLLYAKGRYGEALAAYRGLLEEYPKHGFAYNQIGYCLIAMGRAEEAVPMIEMAMRLDPRSPANYNRYANMSLALLLIGRNEEAIDWSQRALAAHPTIFPHIRAQHYIRMAAANARLGHLDEAHRALAEANQVWSYDTVRMHYPDDPFSLVSAAQIEEYQKALRLAGHRDHADEAADFGAASDNALHADFAGPTPTTAPGAVTIRTAELARLLAEQKPIVIDPMSYWWGRSIPGAIGLKRAGWGDSYTDAAQDRLRRKMLVLTNGDLSAPIVALGFNSERFDGRNLALRLAALGYTKVYWYRGGREAWEVAGLPEAAIEVQEW